MSTFRPTAFLAAAGIAVLLTACGDSSEPAATGSQSPATSASESAAPSASDSGSMSPSGSAAAAPITVSDAWVRAQPDISKSKMTGLFGMVKNTSNAPVEIVSATTTASGMTELHETVMQNGTMVMRKVEKGFTIPANGTFELKPGGNHIMAMNMTKPLKPGENVDVTLTTADGATMSFSAVARTFTEGNEPYATNGASASGSMGSHGSMSPSGSMAPTMGGASASMSH